jgi:hypothetical protein
MIGKKAPPNDYLRQLPERINYQMIAHARSQLAWKGGKLGRNGWCSDQAKPMAAIYIAAVREPRLKAN